MKLSLPLLSLSPALPPSPLPLSLPLPPPLSPFISFLFPHPPVPCPPLSPCPSLSLPTPPSLPPPSPYSHPGRFMTCSSRRGEEARKLPSLRSVRGTPTSAGDATPPLPPRALAMMALDAARDCCSKAKKA